MLRLSNGIKDAGGKTREGDSARGGEMSSVHRLGEVGQQPA